MSEQSEAARMNGTRPSACSVSLEPMEWVAVQEAILSVAKDFEQNIGMRADGLLELYRKVREQLEPNNPI